MQLLLNKASELPALLQRYDRIVHPGGVASIVAVEELCRDFRKIIKSFRDWELMLLSEAPSPVVWSTRDPENLVFSDTDVLWFPDIMTANTLTHCWAFEIIAKRHLGMLGGAVSTMQTNSRQDSSWALSKSSERTIGLLAEMICDSMPYLMQPEMKLYGPGSAHFTFPTAIQVFRSEPDRYSAQLSRCQCIIGRLVSKGFHFARTS